MITRWEPDILKTRGSKLPIVDYYKKNFKKRRTDKEGY